jgi:hypothetical protein
MVCFQETEAISQSILLKNFTLLNFYTISSSYIVERKHYLQRPPHAKEWLDTVMVMPSSPHWYVQENLATICVAFHGLYL